MEHQLAFRNIVFDKQHKTFTISKGSVGTYPYTEIAICNMLNEKAKYTNKEAPFTHTTYAAPLQVDTIFPSEVLVGLQFIMKDSTKLYVYISDESSLTNSLQFYKDREEAVKIKELVKRIIKKYKDE